MKARAISAITRLVVILTGFGVCVQGHSQGRSDSMAVVYAKKSHDVSAFVRGLKEVFKGHVEAIQAEAISDCPDERIVIAFGLTLADNMLKTCTNTFVQVIETEDNIRLLNKAYGQSVRGIILEQPIEAHLKAIEQHIPSLTRVGILYTSLEERSRIDQARTKTSITLFPVMVQDPDRAGITFRRILKDVDAVLVTSNNEIWTNTDLKGFLLSSIRQGKVLIGGSREEFIKAGVLAGSFTDMHEYGIKVGGAFSRGKIQSGHIFPPPGKFKYNRLLASRMSLRVIVEADHK